MKRTHHSRSRKNTYRSGGPASSKNSRNRNWKIWIPVIIVVIIGTAFFTGQKNLFKLYSLHEERNQLLMEKERLIEENEQLREEIEKLQKDLNYIEKMAREKYNLKKDNEEVYIVSPD